jgi:hypothetical protein
MVVSVYNAIHFSDFRTGTFCSSGGNQLCAIGSSRKRHEFTKPDTLSNRHFVERGVRRIAGIPASAGSCGTIAADAAC